MKGTLHNTETGWVVKYNKRLQHKMVGYHDYNTTTVNDELPLHPDDVQEIQEDSKVFDNIDARIKAYPDVEFEIVEVHNKNGQVGYRYVNYAKLIKQNKVSRVEVIDENGRSYVKYFDGECELSYQDEGRTLKIFITPNQK
jgi:hypothetical protein